MASRRNPIKAQSSNIIWQVEIIVNTYAWNACAENVSAADALISHLLTVVPWTSELNAAPSFDAAMFAMVRLNASTTPLNGGTLSKYELWLCQGRNACTSRRTSASSWCCDAKRTCSIRRRFCSICNLECSAHCLLTSRQHCPAAASSMISSLVSGAYCCFNVRVFAGLQVLHTLAGRATPMLCRMVRTKPGRIWDSNLLARCDLTSGRPGSS